MRKQDYNFPDRWIAFFDVLGFSDIVNNADSDYHYYSILDSYNEVLKELSKKSDVNPRCLVYTWFSDSFIIYSKNDSAIGYASIQQAAKQFITSCLYKRIPLRGAISFGPLYANKKNITFIGKALVDAYHQSEEQQWIGLILSEVAIKKASDYGLYPQRRKGVRP